MQTPLIFYSGIRQANRKQDNQSQDGRVALCHLPENLTLPKMWYMFPEKGLGLSEDLIAV